MKHKLFKRKGKIPLVLKSDLCPGDICTMTAAIKSLHVSYPDEFLTDVRTPHPAIWDFNPYITPLKEDNSNVINLGYPLIHTSGQTSNCFLRGYTHDLGGKIGRPLELCTNKPDLYISGDEKQWISQVEEIVKKPVRIMGLVNAGGKSDFITKIAPTKLYRDIINETCSRIQWIQIGVKEHDHPVMDNCINLIGKTDLRQLIRLVYHTNLVLCPVTLLQHLSAAFEKPAVIIAGGREGTTWISSYPKQHIFHSVGSLCCCKDNGCWKSRVVALNDGDKKDESLCEQPVKLGEKFYPRCLTLIKPQEVVLTIERILNGLSLCN